MASVSVPAPPLILSKIDNAVAVAALNVSLPAVPVKVSTLVVSDLFCTQNGVNTHLFYLYFDIRPDIDSITTIDHQ
jgi:hypothetical protein